jgi:hypothetical protein
MSSSLQYREVNANGLVRVDQDEGNARWLP